MLVLSNTDRPGVIGTIGTFLGQHNVNISRMQLSRERPGGQAISVIGIDSPVSPSLLQDLRLLPAHRRQFRILAAPLVGTRPIPEVVVLRLAVPDKVELHIVWNLLGNYSPLRGL